MATQTITCILCKEAHSEETPFMEILPDCLCCNEDKRIHVRCAKMHNQLHESLIKKYMPGYVMCRACTKYLSPTVNTYTQGDDTISISLDICDSYQGWKPHEIQRSETMRSSGHKCNICVKYASKNKGINRFEIWYYPLNTTTTNKPLLMKYWHNNSRNVKHGEMAQYYTNGKLEFSLNYKNGNYDGEYKKYYSNGKVYSIANYVNHNQTGLQLSYFDNGVLCSKYNMKDGSKHGLYEEWYIDEKKKIEWYYINGHSDYTKKLIKWYNDGKVEQEYMPLIENGKNIIKKSSYYTNGQIEYEIKCIYDTSYSDKLKPVEYPYNEHYSNGSIRKTCTKITDDKVQVETFHAQGKKNEVYYINKNGYKHGLYMSWYQSGGREILCMYRRGHPVDESAKWDADGNLNKFGRYDRDGRFHHVTLGV